jgi:mRNA interferase MazF
MTQKLRRGEIWLANLNPTKGTEPGKTRPVLIVQNQILLDINHPSTLIIPLTMQLLKEDTEPLRIKIPAQGKLLKNSALLIDQLRANDNKHLSEGPLVKLNDSLMNKIYQALAIVLGSEKIPVKNILI